MVTNDGGLPGWAELGVASQNQKGRGSPRVTMKASCVLAIGSLR